ncbi:Chromosome (plasmid) partitioning protein ParB [Lactococcus lactis subsp. lactis]|uniref:Chromosome partitioning protein ParB n=2 Tax=Lactococcus lactis TaxID=1358 RepID=A0A2A5S8Y0_LACLH|nr:ParB/RepB/Spo0J family partition protein [Lactococcus lactis]KAA8699962.1 chromosome partitioning protein ParB [Lactococcus lactis subsp. hordniae]KSU06389.1 Chromosome (plasmid) partitioning protein ParB [Lactococcus lactis subsp. lactis]MCT3134435.1 chromosome partitioning protein ParB [Lactococcus lactis]PCS09933.1 ParB-like partition protein [Lactococcus lactis subsp. hordniae]PCS09946.1 ParB-like partition protein [Lactococcus lactis subsp. hordniae]
MAKKNFSFTDIVKTDDDKNKRINVINLTPEELIENKKNNYELSDIEQLADSIEQLGLLQPLLVKKVSSGKYEIVAGHRRFNAIKKLISENRINTNYEILSKIIDEDENKTITGLKLHETNMQTRSLLKLPEEEKLAIIEDYMKLLKQAKEQGIKLNGKPIKGKTRDIIAERFNIGARTASRLIAKTKEKEEGVPNGTPPENSSSTINKLNKIIKQVEKLEFDESEEEIELKEKLISLLK